MMQLGRRAKAKRGRPWTTWLALLACLLVSAVAANWDFGLILQNAQKRYGSLGTAKERIEAWSALIDSSGELPEKEKLATVNRFFNRQLRFVDDQRNWGENDYWATPSRPWSRAPAIARTTPSPSTSPCAASASRPRNCASPTSRRSTTTRHTWCSPTTPAPARTRWYWTT